MALLLVLGFLGIAMIYPQQKESYTSIIESKELVSDTQRALDENGFTVTILDKDLNELDNSGKMAALYTMLKSELPATLDIHLSLKKFESNADDNGCLLDKNFEKCFPDSVTFPEWGSTVPGDREVVGNTFFLVKKSSPGQCDILGMLAAGKEKSKESLLAFFDGPTAYFADANDLNIFFTTTVTPATEAECDQDITVDLNATIPPIGRSPASVMLLVDRSGSTDTYDMKIKTTIGTTSNGTCNGGACHATCYLSNKNTEYDSFTSKQDVATINLTQSTINRIDAGKKIFARVWPDEYTGTCDALGSMVLWVQRPDGVVEKDSGLNYEEDLPASPAAGNYHALLWDDTATPDSYSAIYLGQEPTNNSIYNASFTFPSSVSSYGNIGSAIAVPANTTFALKFHFTYSGYSGASQPRLRINRSGSYYPSYPGYVNCGTAGASSGSCDITVIDNDATGGYAASGNYQVQGRMASGSAATFNLTATHQMENIIYQTETPASNSMYDGSLSFTSTYQSITGTSITVPSNKTFKLIYYFTYSGNSGGKQVWFNISKPGSDVAFNCGTAPSGSCNITVVDNAPSGSYTQNGTYTVQRKVNSGTATINTTITYDMESCTASYCDPVNYGPGTIGNKTCDSSSCVNCPHGTGLTGTSTATNVQTADNFSIGADTVMEHYRGIYADIKNISVDPTAVCTAGIGFQNPIEGSNKNFYFSFPPSSNFCYEISQTGMQTCTNDHIHTTVPLASGDYNVLAWSDKSISYTIDWQEQRIDAAKTSAKTFLNNALWKPADRFGLTWFAGDSSFQGQSMTANKDSVKTALNNLAPSGNTPMALGIATARQGLNSEPAENMKFLILLTDGLANVRYPNTLYGCSGSGFDNTQDWYCVSDAIAQANPRTSAIFWLRARRKRTAQMLPLSCQKARWSPIRALAIGFRERIQISLTTLSAT
ncbi:MAG: VWA domain-containing protein [Candidatus Diapherotrites archaeon]|nr:VWA domain-containing protein [Candidatus Diapherotrites archaeon]